MGRRRLAKYKPGSRAADNGDEFGCYGFGYHGMRTVSAVAGEENT